MTFLMEKFFLTWVCIYNADSISANVNQKNRKVHSKQNKLKEMSFALDIMFYAAMN